MINKVLKENHIKCNKLYELKHTNFNGIIIVQVLVKNARVVLSSTESKIGWLVRDIKNSSKIYLSNKDAKLHLIETHDKIIYDINDL